MLNDLLVCFGVSGTVIPKLWQKPCDNKAQNGYPKAAAAAGRNLSPVHSTLDLYKRQLLPGPKLDVLSKTLLGNIDDCLCWERLEALYVITENSISLKDFCAEFLVDVITRTLFGDRIYELEPELVEHFLDFNDDAWMLVFQVPQSAASKLSKARSKILKCFAAYTAASDDFKYGRAWLIENVMDEQKALDISDQDRAALLLMIYWA
ncbi:MAG: hypothetical protein Q9225_005872 [Loekoesia sp. 1 TL-2023]